MANNTKTSATAAPTYIDFVPDCDLQPEDEPETLVIHLPEFRKNQLKVQVKDRVLKVSGEIPLCKDGTKRMRFVKETKIPKSCDINDIKARFADGSLRITMPKKVTPAAPQVTQQQPAPTSSAPSQPEEHAQKPEADAALISDEHKAKGTTSTEQNGKMAGTSKSYDHPKGDSMFEYGSIIQRLQGRKKVALGFGIAVMTMVAIGAFVASKYRSNFIPSPPLCMDEPGLI